MKILGIDPGTIRCGWGIIETEPRLQLAATNEHRPWGIIEPGAHRNRSTRLACIYSALEKLVGDERPDAIAVENQYIPRAGAHGRPQDAMVISMGRAVVEIVAGLHGVPLHDFFPATVKKSATGSGRASKDTVCRFMGALFGVSGLPEDAADALAVAVTCANHSSGRLLGRAARLESGTRPGRPAGTPSHPTAQPGPVFSSHTHTGV